MPYLPLYSALLTENTPGTISAMLDADNHPNLITGSWVSGSVSGSYNFVSSGSFSGASGSITGSMQVNIYYERKDSNDTGSISLGILDENTLILQTSAYPMTTQLTTGVIQGSCSINIGIQY
jgi:hypothetical protein